jgi:hypothetical protein
MDVGSDVGVGADDSDWPSDARRLASAESSGTKLECSPTSTLAPDLIAAPTLLSNGSRCA